MKNVKSLIVGMALLTLPAVTNAQYLADLSTTVNSTGGGITDRLWLDAAFTIKAPVGARLWIVSDTDNNGLPNYAGGVSPDQVLGAGDQIVFQDIVDGTIFGAQPGRYNRLGISVPDAVGSQHLYAILWGAGTATDESGVLGGDKFGVFDIGVRTPPPVGNASWYIFDNINGTQYSVNVTVVPEPQSAIYGGAALALLAFLRARFGGKALV
jgi:hypothetical protein